MIKYPSLEETPTNNVAVRQLTPIKEVIKVKGFIRHETKD